MTTAGAKPGQVLTPKPGRQKKNCQWRDAQDPGKTLALTDTLGNPVRFELLPGQRHDTVGVAPPTDGIDFGGLTADKAFDANRIIEEMNERGARIAISQHPQRLNPLEIDAELYKRRHSIENFFAKLKEFQRSAMRSNKTNDSFEAVIYPVRAGINSR